MALYASACAVLPSAHSPMKKSISRAWTERETLSLEDTLKTFIFLHFELRGYSGCGFVCMLHFVRRFCFLPRSPGLFRSLHPFRRIMSLLQNKPYEECQILQRALLPHGCTFSNGYHQTQPTLCMPRLPKAFNRRHYRKKWRTAKQCSFLILITVATR